MSQAHVKQHGYMTCRKPCSIIWHSCWPHLLTQLLQAGWDIDAVRAVLDQSRTAMQPQMYTSTLRMAATVGCAVTIKLHIKSAGAHLRGLTAPQQAALAEHLVAAAGGAAAQLPHDRQLLQGKVRRAASHCLVGARHNLNCSCCMLPSPDSWSEHVRRGRHLLACSVAVRAAAIKCMTPSSQTQGKAAAGKAPAPAPAPEAEIAILIDLPPGVEPEDLTPTEEQQLIRTALGIAAAIDTINGLVVPEPAPAVEPQPV